MIVVDASALVVLLVGGVGEAPDAVRRELEYGEDVHAPEVVVLETVNALRGLVRGGKLDPGAADEAVGSLLELRVQLHGHLALAPRVWALRDRLSAYDAAYLATAEVVAARVLVTADGGLAAVADSVLGRARVVAVG